MRRFSTYQWRQLLDAHPETGGMWFALSDLAEKGASVLEQSAAMTWMWAECDRRAEKAR